MTQTHPHHFEIPQKKILMSYISSIDYNSTVVQIFVGHRKFQLAKCKMHLTMNRIVVYTYSVITQEQRMCPLLTQRRVHCRPTTTHNVNVRISGIEAAALPKLDCYPATDRIPELCIWNSCFSCKYKYIYQIEIEIPIQLYAQCYIIDFLFGMPLVFWTYNMYKKVQ